MNTPSAHASGPTPALQGALLAFQNAPRSPAGGGASRSDGFLTPGTSSTAAQSREASPMRRLAPHRAGSPRDPPRRDASPSRSDASGPAEVPRGDWGRAAAARTLSPTRTADSFIAANLAAGSPAARSLSPARTGGPDTGSIPSTTKLISMFEGAEGILRRPSAATVEMDGEPLEGDPVKVDVPERIAKARAKTPIGERAEQQPARPKTPGVTEAAGASSVKPAVKPKPDIDTALLAARQVARALGETADASAAPQPSRGPRPPTPPKPRGAGKARSVSRAPSTTTLSTSTAEIYPAPTFEPTGHARRESVSSDDTFVSASSVQSPPRTPSHALDLPRTPARSQASKSASTSPVRRPAAPPSRNPGPSSLHVGSLSDAMVASSLASTRLTPSNTVDPTPGAARPSPRLLQTLRTGDSGADGHRHRHGGDRGSEEETKRSRRRRKGRRSGLGGNRHSHKEGARKRWAGRISERQRRRYEALWASNKGLLVREHLATSRGAGAGAGGPPKDPEAYVVNVVARELWRRSRLPDDELEEVWGLVDGEGSGMLGRRQFVVGTWLVDQRLRGRKIPARVGESVWDSASGMVMRR